MAPAFTFTLLECGTILASGQYLLPPLCTFVMQHAERGDFAYENNFELEPFSKLQNGTLFMEIGSTPFGVINEILINSYGFPNFLLPIFTYFLKTFLSQSPSFQFAASHL